MPVDAPGLPRVRPGVQALTLVAVVAAGLAAGVALDLRPAGLVPSPGGLEVAGRFFAAAFRPALVYEAAVPAGTMPLPGKVLRAAGNTVVFAAASLSLSLLVALPLSLLASTTLWEGTAASSSPGRQLAGRIALFVARALIALMRSVHELLWAVLLLAAFGRGNLAAVVAIAIPYAGTLAKVFSELLDEAPRDAAEALRGAGASRSQSILLGLFPRALPDMCAYAFYRFECALRSSAVLGFFGFPTLGYFLAASYENAHYREVWTYLYALVLLAAGAELWSSRLRERLLR